MKRAYYTLSFPFTVFFVKGGVVTFLCLNYPTRKSLETMFCCTLSKLLSRYYCGTNWMLSVPFHFTRWPKLLCVSERITSSILLAGALSLLLKLSQAPIFVTVDNCPSGKQQGGDLKIAIMKFYFFVQYDHAIKKEPFETSIPSKQWSSLWPASSHIQSCIFNA